MLMIARLFRVINCDDYQMLFQNDLDKLYNWSQRNLMDFNSKSKIMRIRSWSLGITEKTSAVYRVHLSDTVLEEVKEFKDLG